MDYSKIGHHLKLERERKGLSHEQIFETTRIQPSILKDIEEGKVSVAPVFLKGFIKTYARFLGLDYEALFEKVEKENQIREEQKDPKEEPCLRDKKQRRAYLKYLLFALGFFIVFQTFLFLNRSKKSSKHSQTKEGNPIFQPDKAKDTKVEKVYQTSEDQKDSELEEQKETTAVEQEKTTAVTAAKEQKNEGESIEEGHSAKKKHPNLFDQLHGSVFKKELLIQSSESLKIYFKVDQQSAVTKTLEPVVWFHIKAKNSIYLRFDDNQGEVQMYHNGKQMELFRKGFFEKTF